MFVRILAAPMGDDTGARKVIRGFEKVLKAKSSKRRSGLGRQMLSDGGGLTGGSRSNKPDHWQILLEQCQHRCCPRRSGAEDGDWVRLAQLGRVGQ